MKVFLCFCFLSVLVLADSASAATTITGVADKTVYADSVTFTVSSEAGWDYTAMLNGNPVATDVPVEVNDPEYYELYVHKVEQPPGSAEESTLVQFIVRDSSRGNSEWGLPPWTPYPPIDSAAAEFIGGQLEIITPAEYPMGLEMPVIARVEDLSGNRLGVIGDITASGFEDQPLKLLRGVGSVFLAAATEPNVISYNAEIHSLQSSKQITIEASTTWQTESGHINSNTDWGANARIHVDGVLTIGSSATLTIGAGSVVKIDPDLEIAVNGSIVVNGTAGSPVVFTAEDRNNPWGGFLFEASTSEGDFTRTILTASGADSNWFNNNPGKGGAHRKEQCLFYLSNGANVTLTDCYLIDNHGQAGHGESSYLTMIGCLVQKFITAGQYNAGTVNLHDTALIEFPSYNAPFTDEDNDALYLTGGAHYLTDCLVGWAPDDGVDAGSGTGGTVTVNNCWFESFYHEAMAWSNEVSGSPRIIDINDTVSLNSGQGIECGFGAPDVTADQCFSTANAVGARFGDNYDWDYNGFLTVSNSLLLYNLRDVWGRNWDDWTVRLAQMDIQNNYLSIPNANYPNNTIWAPVSDPNHLDELIPFLPTPATIVGVGLAILDDAPDLADLTDRISVRLSTFTTNQVSVDYTIESDGSGYDSGTLEFAAGESVKFIEFTMPSLTGLQEFIVTISNPVNADLTGYDQVIYSVPYEVSKELIEVGEDWRYFKGSSEPPANWNEVSFIPDGSWLSGPTGIGYEAGSGYGPCIATNLADMRNSYWSVYARKMFNIDNPSRVTELTLYIDFDDGYIAYINGVQVHSQFPPNPAAHDQPATTSNHEAGCGGTLPQYDISEFISALVPGENVLALQVHNTTIGSSDFIFIPALSAVAIPSPGDFEPNGDVDLADLSTFSAAWLSNLGEGNYSPTCDIAIPPDGTIDLLDFRVFADNWLTGF